MATVKCFLDLLCDQVGKGIYVWGGNGEDLTAMRAPTFRASATSFAS